MAPQNYSRTQIGLHWLLAAAIIYQLFTGENAEHAWNAIRRGTEMTASTALWGNVHVWVGIGVLVFALWRLWLRFSRGVPNPPVEENLVLRLIAHGTHFALYALMLLVPVTGIMIWYFGIGAAGPLHGLAKLPFLALIGLHMAGAFWQHFALKSGVLRRMLRPGRA